MKLEKQSDHGTTKTTSLDAQSKNSFSGGASLTSLIKKTL